MNLAKNIMKKKQQNKISLSFKEHDRFTCTLESYSNMNKVENPMSVCRIKSKERKQIT